MAPGTTHYLCVGRGRGKGRSVGCPGREQETHLQTEVMSSEAPSGDPASANLDTNSLDASQFSKPVFQSTSKDLQSSSSKFRNPASSRAWGMIYHHGQGLIKEGAERSRMLGIYGHTGQSNEFAFTVSTFMLQDSQREPLVWPRRHSTCCGLK